MTKTEKITILSLVLLIFLVCCLYGFKQVSTTDKSTVENSSIEENVPQPNEDEYISEPVQQPSEVHNTEVSKEISSIKNIQNKSASQNHETNSSLIQITNQMPENNTAIQEQVQKEIADNNNQNEKLKLKQKKYNVKRYSDDLEIIEALNLLQNSGQEDVIKNIHKNSMRVKFDDFSFIYYKRDLYFGMTAYNQYGTKLILVNSMYKSAPVEQIACVIAHESMHTKMKPTLEEENLATNREAECWKNLKAYSKKYPDTKLTLRLNKLTESNSEEIEKRIAKTPVYQELK